MKYKITRRYKHSNFLSSCNICNHNLPDFWITCGNVFSEKIICKECLSFLKKYSKHNTWVDPCNPKFCRYMHKKQFLKSIRKALVHFRNMKCKNGKDLFC